jgi:hypothetical protein
MSNTFIELPCSNGTANGADTNVAGLSNKKTLVCVGLTAGVVNIAGSDDGGTTFTTELTISADGVYELDCSYAEMRCESKGVAGSPNIDIGSTNNAVVDVDLNVPAGAGNGTAGNTSQLGTALTISVGGTFGGVVNIQVSNDNSLFATVASFTGPGEVNIQGPFSRMRVNRAGTVTGTPVVSVAGAVDGAVAPAMFNSPDAAGLGGALVLVKTIAAGTPGTADDVTIYNANVPFDMVLYDCMFICTTLINPSTTTLRDTAGGAGAALSTAFNTATAGNKRNTDMATAPTLGEGDSVFLRRSDRGVAGVLVMYLQKA